MYKALNGNLPGQWRSIFRCGDLEEVHYMTPHKEGNRLVLQSQSKNRSYCIIRLTIDERIATGSWEIQGYEDKAASRVWGALQLVLNDDGLGASGMWVGFGSELSVKAGTWDIDFDIEAESKYSLNQGNLKDSMILMD